MVVNLHTNHYRFGVDELAENTHGWHAAEDANPAPGVIGVDTVFLLRFNEQETGGTAAGNTDSQFQYRRNGGGWNNITTTSSVVKAVVAAALTNNGACTQRLSGTGTFETSGAGQTEDGLSGGASNDIAASGCSETECGLQIVGTDVLDGDTIELRLTSPDWTITNDVVPTITVQLPNRRGLVSWAELEIPELGRIKVTTVDEIRPGQSVAFSVRPEKIVISVKMSHVQDVIKAYTILASKCEYALHVGLTEAGMGLKGAVSSTAALANLLQQGIGDTIRVSLTPAPGGARTEEVLICQHILQSLGMRQFQPSVTACPGCGRTTNTLFQEMSQDMENFFREKLPEWQKKGYIGVESLKIAVMGCIVNGPGESKVADIGISLPGTGENPKAPVFVDGKKVTTLEGPQMMTHFKKLVEDYVNQKFGSH